MKIKILERDRKMMKKYKKPTKEAIKQASRIPNLTLLEKVLAAEMIQDSWDGKRSQVNEK